MHHHGPHLRSLVPLVATVWCAHATPAAEFDTPRLLKQAKAHIAYLDSLLEKQWNSSLDAYRADKARQERKK